MLIEVKVPNDTNVWDLARAVLEVVEKGASGHCLSHQPHGPDGTGVEMYWHHRLNVTVKAFPVLCGMIPNPKTYGRTITPAPCASEWGHSGCHIGTDPHGDRVGFHYGYRV